MIFANQLFLRPVSPYPFTHSALPRSAGGIEIAQRMDTRQINCIMLAGSAIASATSGDLHGSPERNARCSEGKGMILWNCGKIRKEKNFFFVSEIWKSLVIEFTFHWVIYYLIFALVSSFEFCEEKLISSRLNFCCLIKHLLKLQLNVYSRINIKVNNR